MPGLVAEITPVVPENQPYSNTVSGMVNKLRHTGEPFAVDLADALETLQNTDDHIQGMLRANAPLLTDMTVVDGSGDLVGKIGEIPNEDGSVNYGAWFREIYIGDAVGERNPADAPFWANEQGQVYIGKNGSLTVLDPFDVPSAWLGTEFDWLQVTNATNNGAGLIRLEVFDHTLQTGDEVQVDLVDLGEASPNARGVFAVTTAGPDHIDLQNSVFDGAYVGPSGIVDRLLHIVSVTNAAGLSRITTAVDHLYEDSDQVSVAGTGTDADGQWLITVIDPVTFDLRGSVFSGGAVTGTVIRYNAGGLFRTIAVGSSFANYNLRAFADGTLKIRNATIILESGDESIVLDPTIPAIIIRDESTGWQTRLQDGAIYVENTLDGSRAVQIDPSHIFFINNGGVPVVNLNSDGNDGELQLRDIIGTLTIDLIGDTGTIEITGNMNTDANINATGSIDGNEYQINGVTVIDDSRDAEFNSVDSVTGYLVGNVSVVDSSRNATFNSLNLTVPLPISEGGTGADTAGFARNNLDVYSKAQVDAMFTGLATSLNGSHDHGGAVPSDGGHTHTIV